MNAGYYGMLYQAEIDGIKQVPTERSRHVLLNYLYRASNPCNREKLAMIRIAILDRNTYPINSILSGLQQADFAITAKLDGENLSAWLATHGVDILALHMPDANERPRLASSNTKPGMLSGNGQACWQLNASKLELMTPYGKLVPLSHNERCVLSAAANANGNLVSRRILIEALGQDFWCYDERRLESLISRLRRKLAAYAPEGFPIRGVKGQGYLFKVRLQAVEDWC
jgi:hypothetical protein